MSDKSSSNDAPSASSSDAAATPASGAPTVAGGLIIPDLSPLTTLQNDNMQKMTAAVQSAAQGLQSIVSLQKDTLQQALGNLHASLNDSVTTAWDGPGRFRMCNRKSTT